MHLPPGAGYRLRTAQTKQEGTMRQLLLQGIHVAKVSTACKQLCGTKLECTLGHQQISHSC